MSKDKYDIFLSFSGKFSKRIAEKLKAIIIHLEITDTDKVFLADDNIKPGNDWLDKISDALITSRVGIFIFTIENRDNKWLYLEYGAFWYKKAFADKEVLEVIPVYIDFKDGEWPDNPIKKYQVTSFKEGVKESILKILVQVNSVLNKFNEDDIKKYFNDKLEKGKYYEEIEDLLSETDVCHKEQKDYSSAVYSHASLNSQKNIAIYSKVLVSIGNFINDVCNSNDASAKYDAVVKYLISESISKHDIMLSIKCLQEEDYIAFYEIEGIDSRPIEYLSITLEGQTAIRRRKKNT